MKLPDILKLFPSLPAVLKAAMDYLLKSPQSPPTPTNDVTPKEVSNDELLAVLEPSLTLYKAAVAAIGKDISPRDEAADELGCVDSLQEVYKQAFGRYIDKDKTLSTAVLVSRLLQHPLFFQTTEPQPGDITIFPTRGPVRGHCGIWGKSHVMSNSSKSGLWEPNYTHKQWIAEAKKRGLTMYHFTLD